MMATGFYVPWSRGCRTTAAPCGMYPKARVSIMSLTVAFLSSPLAHPMEMAEQRENATHSGEDRSMNRIVRCVDGFHRASP